MSIDRENAHSSSRMIHMPAPTVWPTVLALGITFLFAGLVTNWAISLLGLILVARSSVGWFQEVVPYERHVDVAVVTQVVEINSTRAQVARLFIPGLHRKILPVERYTLGAGVEGGIAGGFAMVIPASLYGLIRYHSLWYAPNLLAAVAIPNWAVKDTAFLASFHAEGLLTAGIVHLLASVLVGLLYGAILPMFPWEPIVTAGFLAPIFWTGLVYGTLEALSPILNQRIDWLWFIASQIAFGLVAGFVVNLHVPVRTYQFQSLPFSERAGLISKGMGGEKPDEDRPQ
ncbi:MAG: hypothetical protein WA426_21190 [Silvibacterium sp.]